MQTKLFLHARDWEEQDLHWQTVLKWLLEYYLKKEIYFNLYHIF